MVHSEHYGIIKVISLPWFCETLHNGIERRIWTLQIPSQGNKLTWKIRAAPTQLAAVPFMPNQKPIANRGVCERHTAMGYKGGNHTDGTHRTV